MLGDLNFRLAENDAGLTFALGLGFGLLATIDV